MTFRSHVFVTFPGKYHHYVSDPNDNQMNCVYEFLSNQYTFQMELRLVDHGFLVLNVVHTSFILRMEEG